MATENSYSVFVYLHQSRYSPELILGRSLSTVAQLSGDNVGVAILKVGWSVAVGITVLLFVGITVLLGDIDGIMDTLVGAVVHAAITIPAKMKPLIYLSMFPPPISSPL